MERKRIEKVQQNVDEKIVEKTTTISYNYKLQRSNVNVHFCIDKDSDFLLKMEN